MTEYKYVLANEFEKICTCITIPITVGVNHHIKIYGKVRLLWLRSLTQKKECSCLQHLLCFFSVVIVVLLSNFKKGKSWLSIGCIFDKFFFRTHRAEFDSDLLFSKSKFEHGLTNTSVTNDLLLMACQWSNLLMTWNTSSYVLVPFCF